MEKTMDIFQKRKITYTLVFLSLILIFCGASLVTQFHLAEGIQSFPAALHWIFSNLIPDETAMERLPKILDKLVETALLSVAVTVLAGICAFFFSLLGSGITKIHWSINRLVRIVAAFFRNVPDVVWAMLLMFSFGQNILTGFFALFFTTFGLLTRVITWVLYMIETNIRSSTLIGILTATGIGYLFDLYYKRLDFSSASLVVLSIVVLVLVIEGVSNKIRKVIL